MTRKYLVTLIRHSEGVSVSCPGLPGCHSQGATVDEALENIRDAAAEYLDVFGEPEIVFETAEIELALLENAKAAGC